MLYFSEWQTCSRLDCGIVPPLVYLWIGTLIYRYVDGINFRVLLYYSMRLVGMAWKSWGWFEIERLTRGIKGTPTSPSVHIYRCAPVVERRQGFPNSINNSYLNSHIIHSSHVCVIVNTRRRLPLCIHMYRTSMLLLYMWWCGLDWVQRICVDDDIIVCCMLLHFVCSECSGFMHGRIAHTFCRADYVFLKWAVVQIEWDAMQCGLQQ